MTDLGSYQETCLEIGSHLGPSGEITAREILVSRQGTRYTITVALPSYREEPGPSSTESPNGENIVILADIRSLEAICQELASRPTKDLQPFLTPQITP